MTRRVPLIVLKPISEINLTPLIDLTFLLLITFIITFPLIEQGIPVNLPRGTAKPMTEEAARTVTVNAEGRIFLDDSPVTLEELAARMVTIAGTVPDVSVMLRADEALGYGKVVEVLKVLNRAKITRMALVTQEE